MRQCTYLLTCSHRITDVSGDWPVIYFPDFLANDLSSVPLPLVSPSLQFLCCCTPLVLFVRLWRHVTLSLPSVQLIYSMFVRHCVVHSSVSSYCSLVAGIFSMLSDNFLLVADENQIFQVDSGTLRNIKLPVTMASQPQVLAYDWLREYIYYTSGLNTSVIFKYSFVDQNTSVLYEDPTGMIAISVVVVVVVVAAAATTTTTTTSPTTTVSISKSVMGKAASCMRSSKPY